MKWVLRAIKLLLILFVLAIPTLGVWVASSMAAFWNGPIWLALAAGFLAFPLLPGLWDMVAMRRRVKKGQDPKDRVLTSADRLVLRTFVLNGVFLVLLLWLFPKVAFTSLATRGDWMLDNRQSHAAQLARRGLFVAAGGLEWVYLAARDNPYAEMGEEVDDEPPPTADQIGKTTGGKPVRDKPVRDQPVLDKTDAGKKTQKDAGQGTDGATTPDAAVQKEDPPTLPEPVKEVALWPQKAELHALVKNMPADKRTSITSVAKYIAANEEDPYRRIKALHDFAADHVVYDFEALDAGHYPPQDAQTVFRTGRGVCAGYANLMVALAKAAGEKAIYVTGDSRDEKGEIDGAGHAWNAVKIRGKWYLMDITWNAGAREGGTFKKKYKTDYLFTPPAYFVSNHLPDKAHWQLLQEPLSRGDFMRQPMLNPSFHKAHLKLLSPKRSQVTVDGPLTISIENPGGIFMMMNYRSKLNPKDPNATECRMAGSNPITATCDFAREGSYLVVFFMNQKRYGTYWSVGQLEVNRK